MYLLIVRWRFDFSGDRVGTSAFSIGSFSLLGFLLFRQIDRTISRVKWPVSRSYGVVPMKKMMIIQ